MSFLDISDILDISPGEGGGLFSEIQLKLFYLSVLDILDIPPEEESILSEIQLRLKTLSLLDALVSRDILRVLLFQMPCY